MATVTNVRDTYDEHAQPALRGRQANELVLPEGEFAYIQDTTKGVTQVKTGPAVVNLQGQDRPVVFNEASSRFDEVTLSAAAKLNVVVPRGSYCVLQNPAPAGKHPQQQSSQPAVDLLTGQCEHIAGPASFALWPRQTANVIEGHQLRLNQYLVIRVYDEDAARANWTSAIMKRARPEPSERDRDGSQQQHVASVSDDAIQLSLGTRVTAVPDDLSVGRMLIIRGTDVSFYIPPTGIEVMPDDDGNYAREALTLERLQYCILIDENGRKQYVRGPDVVFPLPTQRFHTNDKDERRFRPIELNGPIQGIHVKVIASYVDERGDHGPVGATYDEGDELFITGATTPIYFPCEQHSGVRYDGRTKHFATAIPAGDARYLLDRHSGHIETLTGGESGTMVLPDPRKQVFVRRVLTDAECNLMYPGNADALAYNNALRALQHQSPSSRKGVVSEGQVARSSNVSARRSVRTGSADPIVGTTLMYAAGAPDRLSVDDTYFADASLSHGHTRVEMGGDEFSRAASYTEPRVVTLGNDKFAGVPKIDVWTGYAVMVKDTAGNRRVVLGPRRVLLDFNETLEALMLSTGKPKSTDGLLHTSYLQVINNKVSDIVSIETQDHVTVTVKLSLRVNFEGDDLTLWFSTANYVKLLCDHVRSVLKATARRVTVEEFFTRSEDFVRDAILGAKVADDVRPGMSFVENAMRVYDVEVLSVEIGDESIRRLLADAQTRAVESKITLTSAERELDALLRKEDIKRRGLDAQAETRKHESALRVDQITQDLSVGLEQLVADVKRHEHELLKQKARDAVADASADADRERIRQGAELDSEIERKKQALREEWLLKETHASVERLQAVQPGFSEALLALGNQETLSRVAEALSVQRLLGGGDLPTVVQRVFDGTPLADVIGRVVTGAALPAGRKNGTEAPATHAQRASRSKAASDA